MKRIMGIGDSGFGSVVVNVEVAEFRVAGGE